MTIKSNIYAAFVLTLMLITVPLSNAFAMDEHKMDAAVKHGSLEITRTVARATPPGAPVGGGYLTIKNTGTEADRLVGGSADFTAMVEVHEMKMDGDVMKMRKLSDGIEIPAGGEVVLKPGGYHLMFMKLSEQLQSGEMRKVTLEFEKAGSIELDFSVKTLIEIRKGMKAADMDHSSHN